MVLREDYVFRLPLEEITQVLEAVDIQRSAAEAYTLQELARLNDKNVEVGILQYQRDTITDPYWYQDQKAYYYLLEGEVICREVETGKKHIFRKGDFFATIPHVCLEQRMAAGTVMIAIKPSSIYAKIGCETCMKKLECENILLNV